MAASPTKRSLDLLRAEGWTVRVVEVWNPHAHVRQDLFGCIDILAMKPGHPLLGIQATSETNHAARRAKALAEPRLVTWLSTGSTFEVWSWRKRRSAARTKKGIQSTKMIWTVRREALIGVQVVNEGVAA